MDGNWTSLGNHDCDCTLGNVASFGAANIEIYPNPSNGIFTIRNISDVRNIQINDILGKMVLSQNNTKNHTTLAINKPNGVYFVQLAFKNGEKVIRKVVIK